MNRFHPPVQIDWTEHEKFNVSTIQHAIGWYETAVFYPNGHSRLIPNEAANEHDAIVNHRYIFSNLVEKESNK